MTARERLELFVPVCRAVQHAHQKGIIHRDLKPSNILVALYDGRPVPKVIDFGVAKAVSQRLTDKTMFTGLGQIVGTIEYMSPEQAHRNQLDIDTRSDVYSLGVVLYELLTGDTPFDRRRLRSVAFDELLRIIREEESPRPSIKLSGSDTLPSVAANRRIEPARLSKLVRGELDWIVMKALEKERARRYETANGLAADLQRYLDDEPVVACPPSVAYRFHKFARRNKASLLTAGLVAAALLVGTIVSSWQAVRATRAERLVRESLRAEQAARHEADTARQRAESAESKALQARDTEQQARQEAEAQRQRAEANFALARSAVDEYLDKVTDDQLLQAPGMLRLRQELLSAALIFYRRFAEAPDSDGLRSELASAYYRLGRIHAELGDTEASRAANERAITLYESIREQGDDSTAARLGLARAYFFSGRFDQAAQLCQELLQQTEPPVEARALLAEAYNELAVRASKKGNQAECLSYHQQAFTLREELARQFPENGEYLAHIGSTLNNLGALLAEQQRWAEALAMFCRGTEYERRAYEIAPESILWAVAGDEFAERGRRPVKTRSTARGAASPARTGRRSPQAGVGESAGTTVTSRAEPGLLGSGQLLQRTRSERGSGAAASAGS